MSKYGVISGPNTGKYGPEITWHLYTFHAVSSKFNFWTLKIYLFAINLLWLRWIFSSCSVKIIKTELLTKTFTTISCEEMAQKEAKSQFMLWCLISKRPNEKTPSRKVLQNNYCYNFYKIQRKLYVPSRHLLFQSELRKH